MPWPITFRSIGIAVFYAALCGCISDKPARELSEQITAPFAEIAGQLEQITAANDLGYATAAFQRKNARWPTNHSELTTFVHESGGLLTLREYDRVEFTPKTEGGLDVLAVLQNQTNRFTFSPKTPKQN